MIEEQHIRFVAAADVTDDCRVEIQLRKPRQALTPSQARELAAEIIHAAGHAERAAQELLHEHDIAGFDRVASSSIGITGTLTIPDRFIHPECVAGKCGNCDGQVLSIDDRWVPCSHHCHTAGAAA